MTKNGHEPVGLDEIEAIYEARFAAFLRSVTAIVRDVDTARDCVHDAFAAAIRRRGSFRGDGTLEAWLWKIVINHARDAHGRQVLRQAGERSGISAAELTVDGSSRNHEAAVVREAVSALSERQRLVVFLRYYADLDYAEIAEVLGIRAGTVGSTLNTARAELLRALEAIQEVHR